PERGVEVSREAARLGRRLGQPSSLALALHFAAMLHQCRREGAATRDLAGEVVELAAEHGFSFWHAGGTVLGGWADAACGSVDGVDRLRRGLAAWRDTGSVTYLTYYLALMAEVRANHGQVEVGAALLDEALAVAARTSEGLYEAELHRLKGELLLKRAEPAPWEAEAGFRQAPAG